VLDTKAPEEHTASIFSPQIHGALQRRRPISTKGKSIPEGAYMCREIKPGRLKVSKSCVLATLDVIARSG
jgi:hypothetical protein